jgi:hypothetical protein
MKFILPLRVTGLDINDLFLSLYKGITPISLPANLTVTEDSELNYLIDNLPEGSSENRYTLTAEYPEGVGYSFVWGGKGTPSHVIVPVREVGLTVSDFEIVVYRNGELQDDINIALSSALSARGDYAISGWDITTSRERATWVLIWSRVGSGISQTYSWQEGYPTVAIISNEFLSGKFPAPLLRRGVALAKKLTPGVQQIIIHQAYIGEIKSVSSSQKLYAGEVEIDGCIVDRTYKQVQHGGQLLSVIADITILRQIEGNGALTRPPRREPIDVRDKITLADGTSGVIVGFMPGFANRILLG